MRLRTLLIAMAMLAGGAASASAQSTDYGDVLDTAVALTREGTVDVSLMGGRVNITGADGSQVRIKARATTGALQFYASPSRVRLGVDTRRHERNSNAQFDITVPRGTRVIVNSMSAPVAVRNVRGEVNVESMSGGVEISDAIRKVTAHTLSGRMSISSVDGDIECGTVSGPIQMDEVAGDVAAESVSGRLLMTGVRSKLVRTGTVSGRIEYAGTFDPAGTYEFKSHSGGLRLVVPANSGARFRIESFNGSVSSDFPVTLQPKGFDNKLEYTIGDGRARVVAETFSGSIRIERDSGRE
jgi:putative adhesin